MFIFEPKANTDIAGMLGLVLILTLKLIFNLNFLVNLISVPAPVKKETLASYVAFLSFCPNITGEEIM
jgi:hypothetical protein